MSQCRRRTRRFSLLTFVFATLSIATGSAQPSSKWVLRESGLVANLWGIAEGTLADQANTRIVVAVGEQGAIVISRDAGVTWSRQQSGTTAWLTAVGYFHLGGTVRRFIAVGEGGIILASPDGATWTREISPTSIRLNAIGPGRVSGTAYAFGEAGAGWLIRDLDGTWSRHAAPFSNRWMRGSGTHALVGERGAVFIPEVEPTDPDGLPNWRSVSIPVDADLEGVALAPSIATGVPANSLIAVGANGTIVQQRPFEGDWVTRNSGTSQRLRGIAVKSAGSVTIVTNTQRLELMELFAAGTNGTVLRSADGVAWQPDVVPTQRNLNGVVTIPDAVIAVGDGGTILTLHRSVGGPVIVRQPTAGYDDQGRPFLEAEAAGDGALTYMWVQLTAGAPWFVGAGSARLTPQPPLRVPSPAFQLIVGNAFGITRSEPIVPHRMANFSLLGWAGAGEATLIGGFSLSTVGVQTAANVLIRAIGPGLRGVGVTDPLNAPKLSVYAGDRLLGTNTVWHTAANAAEIRQAAARGGAFPLAEDSRDAALLLPLVAGNYTVAVDGADGGSGPVLLEIYDVDALPLTRLGNLSVRSAVRPGERLTIGGLVITGGLRKSVLVRVAGPALRQFELSDVLVQPRMIVRRGAEIIATGGAWSAGGNVAAIRRAEATARAFPFADASADAAMLVELGPGAHTIEVTDMALKSGVALIEIYEQP